jgi:hypothetical protein
MEFKLTGPIDYYICDFQGTDKRNFRASVALAPIVCKKTDKTVIYVFCTEADLMDSKELHGNALWAGYGDGIFTGVFGSCFNSVSEAIVAIDKAAFNSFSWAPKFVD